MTDLLENLIRSNFSRDLRNIFKIKQSFSYKPNSFEFSVSDFFFWANDDILQTKFYLNNLASQVLPEDNFEDLVKIFIYSNDGLIKKIIDIKLKRFESRKIDFQKLGIKGFGSFCVFHTFRDIETTLKPYGSYLSERGYLAFSIDNENWNFVHGNTACLQFTNKKPKNLLCKTPYKNIYRPQIIFDSKSKNILILNNPSDSDIKIQIKEDDCNNKFIKVSKINIKKKGTIMFDLNQSTCFTKIVSSFLLHRPLILRNYDSSIDILHG